MVVNDTGWWLYRELLFVFYLIGLSGVEMALGDDDTYVSKIGYLSMFLARFRDIYHFHDFSSP